MNVYLLSHDVSLWNTLMAALQEPVRAFANPEEALSHLLGDGHLTTDLLIVDMRSVPNAANFILFVKSSSNLRTLSVVAIGSNQDFIALSSDVVPSLAATIRAPFSAADVALVATRLRNRFIPPGSSASPCTGAVQPRPPAATG